MRLVLELGGMEERAARRDGSMCGSSSGGWGDKEGLLEGDERTYKEARLSHPWRG